MPHTSVSNTILIAFCSGFLGSLFVVAISYYFFPALYSRATTNEVGFEGCNVLGLQVHGLLVSTRSQIPISDMIQTGDQYGTVLTPNYAIANQLVDMLDWAATDSAIRAVIVDIDSPGGTVGSGEEIAHAVRRFGKPSVSVIHDLGTSAGYLVAAATHHILANNGSTVGSIGATYSFLNQSEKNEKEGLVYQQLSSGPFKDMLSPDKPLTDEERTLIDRNLEMLHENFINEIASYRGLPREHVEKLADGSALLGSHAQNEGLVDEIGGVTEAIAYLSPLIGEPVSICWR